MTLQQAEYAILHGTIAVGTQLRYDGYPDDGTPPGTATVQFIYPGRVVVSIDSIKTWADSIAELTNDCNWSYYHLPEGN